MTASPASRCSATPCTVVSVIWPAGTITHTALGALSFPASSSREAAGSAPSEASCEIASGLTS
jgi:hypothetical protein